VYIPEDKRPVYMGGKMYTPEEYRDMIEGKHKYEESFASEDTVEESSYSYTDDSNEYCSIDEQNVDEKDIMEMRLLNTNIEDNILYSIDAENYNKTMNDIIDRLIQNECNIIPNNSTFKSLEVAYKEGIQCDVCGNECNNRFESSVFISYHKYYNNTKVCSKIYCIHSDIEHVNLNIQDNIYLDPD